MNGCFAGASLGNCRGGLFWQQRIAHACVPSRDTLPASTQAERELLHHSCVSAKLALLVMLDMIKMILIIPLMISAFIVVMVVRPEVFSSKVLRSGFVNIILI